MKHLHVNASLPKCGSELLQCLLSQHPEVYGSAQSPFCDYMSGAHAAIHSPQSLTHGFKRINAAHAAMIRHAAKGFYGTFTKKPVAVDKSRAWLIHMEMLWKSYPDAKMLVMYRDYSDIMESLDRKLRENPAHPDFQGAPVNKEVRFQEYWPKRAPLAWALPAYEERRTRLDSRVLYIKYDTLVKSHEKVISVMRQVFDFIGVKPIDVDPTDVKKEAYEIDGLYGPLGDHNVRPVVERRKT